MPRSDKRRNVYQVQEMFASLGLPVCDDADAIKAACEEQRGTRNRELNSTKGSVAVRAQQWFDDVNTLLNKRDELLEVAFEEFCTLADTVLRSDIDGGRTCLGADTQLSLRDIAISWCRARSDLATLWLSDYLERRGLSDSGDFDQPHKIRDFKASARSGRVMLTWTSPDNNYDEVRIVRAPEPAGDPSTEVVVYEGNDSSFLDTSVSPRGHYTYRAYSIYEGRRSLTAVFASTARRGGSNVKIRPALAAALLSVVAVGLVAYDHFYGSDFLMQSLLNGQDASAAEQDPETVDGDEQEPATSGSDVVEVAEVADPTPPVADPITPRLAPSGKQPRAWMTRPPTLAFADQTLNIELAFTEPMRPELFESSFTGVSLKRLEFDLEPPSVRLSVHPLADGVAEGEARWAFRLSTVDGRLTEVVHGNCLVVP